MASSDLTAARLRELLDYDPKTGLFTWRVFVNPRSPAGAIAGYISKDGYRYIRINKISYLAHRLAWLFVTERWPAADIDHINGVRKDNRFANLREATRAENLQNVRKAFSTSKTGLLGASPHQGRFLAQIMAGGKHHYLGVFDTAEEAHAAYMDAKKQLHPFQTMLP